MPQITLNIPSEKLELLKEVSEAMGLESAELNLISASPEWHQQVLNERLEKFKSGHSKLHNWEDFKKKIIDNR
jgi:hypothetical protein